MKPFTFICLLFFLLPAFAQAQETVLPITVVEKDNDFYVEQERLWRKVVEKDPANVVAWDNLYKAARYIDFPAVFNDPTYKKKVGEIVEEMGKAIPNSFEFHYISAWHNGFGDGNMVHLLKAYEIDSTRPKIYEDLFTQYYADGEWKKAERFIKKWYDSQTLAPQLLHVGYNFLACVEEGGVLFTSGDNDSYPVWMLQMARGIRPDVATFNGYLILDAEFARNLLRKYDLKMDAEGFDLLQGRGPGQWSNLAKFIRRLGEQNPGRRIYLPITAPKELYSDLEEDLYLVGTVFEYCPHRVNYIAYLERNWYRNMKLDYLDFEVYNEEYAYTPAGLPYTVTVYLYPAMALCRHYEVAGEAQKAADLLEFGKKVSQMVGDPELYQQFLKGFK